MTEPRAMAFKRHGRSYHLVVRTAADLEQVLKLDEALWVATGAPLDSLINGDPVLLDLVDSDGNKRILCGEMKDAIRWTLAAFKDRSGVDAASTTLKMSALDASHPDGKRIVDAHRSARKLLSRGEAPGPDEVTLDQVRAMKAKVEATPVSELGVVLPEAAKDPELAAFVADIVATLGGAPHPAGRPGANQELLDRFLAVARAYLDWRAKGEIPAGAKRTDVMPLGDATAAAFDTLTAARGKLDTFFVQCRGVELDAKLGERMGPQGADLDKLDLEDAATVAQVLKDAPVARPNPERALDFAGKLNPCYAAALADLRASAVEPALGREARRLSEADWEQVKSTFAAHEAWRAAKPAEAVDALGAEKLARYLDPKFKAGLEALVAEGAATAFVLSNIRLTEKAVLYQACLLLLVNNFVSFPDLYEETRHAMFENGALVMDGRRFNLAIKVTNRGAHADVAKNGSMFVVYVELTSRHDGRKMEVVLPVVAGGRGNLNVGKRGLFIDLAGDEWDAQVVQIIENPISLIEAILSPFTRLGKMVTGKIESASASAEAKFDATAMSTMTKPPSGAPAPAAAPSAGGGVASLLMGGSVAVAALGAGAAYISTALRGTTPWKILIGLAVAIIVLLSPLMLLAILKLRRRDLSAILEGSGWAINARMRLTRRQAAFFTRKPRYPKDAEGIRGWGWWIAAAAATGVLMAALGVGWYFLATSPLRRALPRSASNIVVRRSKARPSFDYYQTAAMPKRDFAEYCARLDAEPCAPGGAAFDNSIVVPGWIVSPGTDNAFVSRAEHVTTWVKYEKGVVYVKSVAR